MTDLTHSFMDFSLPKIMAVLNVTPDSFSDGGTFYTGNRQPDLSRVLNRVDLMLSEGAHLIDVGGESTRPGAEPVSSEEELARVLPVVEAIVSRFDVPVSVDTSTPSVISEAARAGASMINDVRALRRPGALTAAATSGLPVCLMHMLGEPQQMQLDPGYVDITADVKAFLLERATTCEAAGIPRSKILIDPGFGFGKTLQHNLILFRSLPELVGLGFPVLVGVSRKSLVGAILDKPVEERMVGSVALGMLAIRRGVKVLRVHDISATADALKILQAVEG
ncbi:dihydropteroate synthase [Porticoccus hydrocarbonoclasticus]|uniref:dihydropteroate synthase n=1 Tax=Porticoccus hydrocarbonoclasticus TaxID=1073414 RepID=UPI002354A72B|nr:dihydropteroate synthase [Porticoccus hydrocarbonoclasticus]